MPVCELNKKDAKRIAESLIEKISRNLSVSKRPNGKYLLKSEKRLATRIKKVFLKQLNWILRESKNLRFFKQHYYQVNSPSGDIEDFLDGMPGQKDLTEEIIAIMKSSVTKGAKNTIRTLNLGHFGISFSLRNEKAIQFLEEKKILELSDYKGTIHDTTKQKISEILVEAAKNGQSYQETAKQIMAQGDSGVFSQARGELIATREIGIAYETGNNIPVQEFLEKYPDRKAQKYWQTVEDDNVTKECKSNQKKDWVAFDYVFLGLGDDSDDHAPRGSNPRCRCFTKYRII